jgi:Ca2+-binding RTX toxin-like protein
MHVSMSIKHNDNEKNKMINSNQAGNSEQQQLLQSLESRSPSLYEIFHGQLASQVRRLAQWRKRGGVGAKAQQARRQKAMQFEAIEPRILLSADLGLVTAGAFTSYFNTVQVQLDSDVFAAPIPLIGTQLATIESGRIAKNISDALLNFSLTPAAGAAVTTADVTAGLRAALGSTILNDQIGVNDSDPSNYRFSLTLTGHASEQIDLDLALGEDALITAQLGVLDEVKLDFDWSFDLVFGVFENAAKTESAFYVDTASTNELQLENIVALLDGGGDQKLAAKGTAGIFGALIQMDQGQQAKAATLVDPAVAFVAAKTSQFTGRFDIDVTGGGADRRLTSTEIPALGVTGLVTGKSDIYLDIDASLIPDFADVAASKRVFNLGVEADVAVSQVFSSANTQDAEFGNKIDLIYEGVRLDLGTFVTEFFDPTVKVLQTALQPLKPIVDFLTFPIPVISDIGEAVGYGVITPLDLGILTTPINPKLTPAERDKVLTGLVKTKAVMGFLDVFFDLKPLGQGLPKTADLGDFAVQLTAGGKRDPAVKPKGDVLKPTLTRMNASRDLLADIDKAEAEKPEDGKFGNAYASVNGNLTLPFLNDPTSVLKMLMGDTTPELVNFGVDFGFGYNFGQEFPIPGLPVLKAQLEFDLSAALDFDAGFDLFGAKILTNSLDFSSDEALQKSVDDNVDRLGDGFFFDDHFGKDAPADLQDGDMGSDPIVSTGIGASDDSDNPELTLSAKMTAGVKVGADLVVAEFTAGVNLFFNTSVFFDLNDLPNPQTPGQLDYVNELRNTADPDLVAVPTAPYTYDGRVRIGELALIADADAFGIFNTSGALTAGLEAYVFASVGVSPFEIILLDEEIELVNINVYDFDIYKLDDAKVLRGDKLNAPVIGAVTGGTLNLFMGEASAAQRVNTGVGREGRDNEINEGFSITSAGLTDPNNPNGGETLLVKFLVLDDGQRVERAQQGFKNVRHINASGGSGNDSIVVDKSVKASVNFSGGEGADVLTYAGSGVAVLSGGGGVDMLVGGSNNDELDGGDGDDVLKGGAGTDTLRGGNDNDRIDGGLGDDILIGGDGGDTYSWAPGQGADGIFEDPDRLETDRITISGSASADAITLTKVLVNGAAKIQLVSGNGAGPVETLLIDNIEGISINAGAGSDVVTIGDLSGTDVQLLAVDLSAPGNTGNDRDRVIYTGSPQADTLTVEGVVAGFSLTDLGADPTGGSSTQISKSIVQLRDQTAGRDSRFYIINSTPGRDSLEVRGLGGNDTLSLSAGSAGIDVSDLIAVTLDGGNDNDTLNTVYDNVTLFGGGGVDSVNIGSDGKTLVGISSYQLFATDLLIDRVATDRSISDRLRFSEVEAMTLSLDDSGTGNDLRVVSTIAGSLGIVGGIHDDTMALETLAAATSVTLRGQVATPTRAVTVNTVTVGKDGSVAAILGSLDIHGSADGIDQVVFDSSAEVANTQAQIGATALTGLAALGALRYDAAVESVELKLGLGADTVDIEDLTRRVIVDLGDGIDEVNATLLGTPSGLAGAASVDTRRAEQVRFFNGQNTGAADWLLSGDTLWARTAGQYDALDPGHYDQQVLHTSGAERVELSMGDGPGADRLQVRDLQTETHVFLRGGDDRVTVGDSRLDIEAALVRIDAPLVLDGGTGADKLFIDDTENSIPSVLGLIGPDSISGFAMGAGGGRIDYTGFTSLDVSLADVQDNVRVRDTVIATTIRLGEGNDVLVVENTSATTSIFLDGGNDLATVLAGSGLTLTGGDGPGTDTLVFDISQRTTPSTAGVLGQSGSMGLMTNLGPIADVRFAAVEATTVELGQHNDAFVLDIAVPDLFVTVHGNGGDDTVTVRRIPPSTTGGPTTDIDGGSGLDTVVLDIPEAPWASTGSGADKAYTHGNLLTGLGVVVESLQVDNAGYNGMVGWRIDDGKLSAVDPSGVEAPIALVFVDIADDVRILAGRGALGQNLDSLSVTATSNPVEATIDGNSIELLAGRVVLERQAAANNLSSRNNVIDFDGLLPSSIVRETITDVNVSFDISHTYDEDVTLELISPSGTSVLRHHA